MYARLQLHSILYIIPAFLGVGSVSVCHIEKGFITATDSAFTAAVHVDFLRTMPMLSVSHQLLKRNGVMIATKKQLNMYVVILGSVNTNR